MIEVLQQPEIACFVGDRLFYKFRSLNKQISGGAYARRRLEFSAASIEDHYITLSWNNNTISFTCKDNPDNSGTQFKSSGILSLNSWLYQTASYFLKNFTFLQNFNVIVVGNTLYIEAKSYSITGQLHISHNTTLTITEDIEGVAPVYRENFGIVSQVYRKIQSSVDTWPYELLGEDLLDLDSEFFAWNQIEEYLKPAFEFTINYPEGAGDLIKLHPEGVLQFFTYNGEIFGEDPEEQGFSSSQKRYCYNAGISKILKGILNAENKSIYAEIYDRKMFLTWAPDFMKVNPDQPVKLYWISLWKQSLAGTTINLKAKVYYNSGTITTYTLQSKTVYPFDLVEFIVSPGAALYDYLPSGISQYTVWIEDNAEIKISEERTYMIDNLAFPNRRLFVFRNSLGAAEIIRCTGIVEKSESFTREMANVILPYDFTNRTQPRVPVSILKKEIYSASSGWTNINTEDGKYYLDYFSEILLSEEIYEIINGKLFPIEIISTKVDKQKDNEYMHAAEFEYTRGHEEAKFSYDISMKRPPEGSFSLAFENSFSNPNTEVI